MCVLLGCVAPYREQNGSPLPSHPRWAQRYRFAAICTGYGAATAASQGTILAERTAELAGQGDRPRDQVAFFPARAAFFHSGWQNGRVPRKIASKRKELTDFLALRGAEH